MTPHPAAATPAGRSLDRDDYKTLLLSALGGALEFYDFVVFVFFSTVLGQLFFPPGMPEWLVQLQTLGIFAAGYLARPVGGMVIAHYGDLLGRKRMFALSVFLMAVPTLVIGLLPTYASAGIAAPVLLLAMRVLQGAAIGGEMPGAWIFVAEHVPGRRQGFAVGALTSGITGGILLGSLVAIALNAACTPREIHDGAWRIPFLLGGVFGLVSVYLRRFLRETPVFRDLASRRALAREMPLKTVVREHRLACVLTAAMTWALSTAVVVVILMTPALLQRAYGVPTSTALAANCLGTLALTLGCALVGWMADRFGLRATLVVAWGGLAIAGYWFYANLHGARTLELCVNYTLVGLFCGAVATMPMVGVRVFPPSVAFSGLSLAYNLAYAVFGGLTPVLTQLWLQRDPLAPAHYVALVSLIAAALAFVPLTAGGWRVLRRTEGGSGAAVPVA